MALPCTTRATQEILYPSITSLSCSEVIAAVHQVWLYIIIFLFPELKLGIFSLYSSFAIIPLCASLVNSTQVVSLALNGLLLFSCSSSWTYFPLFLHLHFYCQHFVPLFSSFIVFLLSCSIHGATEFQTMSREPSSVMLFTAASISFVCWLKFCVLCSTKCSTSL